MTTAQAVRPAGGEFDVILVGAGPVGLVLANLLGGHGVRTLALERGAGPAGETRAVTLDDEALRVLQATGLADECAAGMLLDGVTVAFLNGDGERLLEVRPSSRPYGFPMVALFHQPALEATLRRGLGRYPHVALAFGHEVSEIEQGGSGVRVRGCTAAGEPFEVGARYLVGCDGGKRLVRRALGVELHGTTSRERWLVIDAETDEHDDREVHFYCDPGQPAVRVPGPGGRRRWEFLLAPGEPAAEALGPARARALLARYPQPRRFEIKRHVVYTFHARNALRYRSGPVFLAGDAAHLMPPFFGQGVSTGCRDAHNLSWKLARAVAGRSGEALLDTYQDERRPHAEANIRASVLLGRFIMTRSRWTGAARDRIFSTLSRHEATASFLREGRFKPASRVRGPLVWTQAWPAPLSGHLLPQPAVESAGTRRMLDDELGRDFCLVGVDHDPRRVLPGKIVEHFERLGLRFVALAGPGRVAAGGPCPATIVDAPGCFAAARGEFLAVRPDRFVSAHFRPEDAPAVADHLARALAAP